MRTSLRAWGCPPARPTADSRKANVPACLRMLFSRLAECPSIRERPCVPRAAPTRMGSAIARVALTLWDSRAEWSYCTCSYFRGR